MSLNNDWSKEINIRINLAVKTFYALMKILNSKMLQLCKRMPLYLKTKKYDKTGKKLLN